jgi:hypothetical protein
MPSQYQLCVSFDSNKAVGIPAQWIASGIVLFLAADEAPNLVALNIRDRQAMNTAFQKPFALVANQHKQRTDCAMVDASESFYSAHRASLSEKLYDLGRIVKSCRHAAKRRGVIFSKSLVALIAAEALKTVAVFSKFLAAGIAVVTRHFGLPFPQSKPIMFLLVGIAAHSAIADLAPLSIGVEGGACYLLSPTKRERAAFLAAFNLATLNEPLQNSVDEREGILNILKVVSPILKRFSNLNSTDLLAWGIAVKGRAHKICPCNLGLYLLPKSVLKADFRGLQLRDLYIQLISLLNFAGNLSIHFLQRLLENLCHISTSISLDDMLRRGVTSCQAKL